MSIAANGGAWGASPFRVPAEQSPRIGPFAHPPIPRAAFDRRIQRVRAAMRKAGLDCLLVSSVLNHAVRYVGFFDTELQGRGSGSPQLVSVLLPLEHEPVLFLQTFTAANYMLPRAQAATYVDDLRLVGGSNQNVLESVVDQLHAWKLDKATVGLAGGEIDWAERLFLQDKSPALHILDANPFLDSLRIVKEPEEIALMRQAASIGDRAMREVEKLIRPGVTDYELYAAGIAAMIRAGADEDTFVLMGIGPSSSPMIMDPLNGQQVRHGDVIVYEVLPFYRLYNTELAVTFAVGKQTAEQTRAAEAAQAAYNAGMAACKPGAQLGNMVAVALEAFKTYGFQSFTHTPGHFIGLDNYEGPPLRSPSLTLTSGMVFSFHPNVVVAGHVKEEVCGMILVNDDGVENLSHFPPQGIRLVH